jgi:hypothetical protein
MVMESKSFILLINVDFVEDEQLACIFYFLFCLYKTLYRMLPVADVVHIFKPTIQVSSVFVSFVFNKKCVTGTSQKHHKMENVITL